MNKMLKKDWLPMLLTLPVGEREKYIAQLLGDGSITEEDIAVLVIEDIRLNFQQYADKFKSDELLRFLWNRFKDHPQYLARALVRVLPEVFYAYGFAFRLVMKLKANLGPVVIPPVRPSDDFESSLFVERLPEMVQKDLLSLDQERRFRECLWWFSRDPQVGFEELEESVQKETNEYDRRVLEGIRVYCLKLLNISFPDFVSDIDGSLFPSFHVRWWIDRLQGVSRVLNIGDTGTQKTAFATVAMHHYGCRKVLVLCPSHARLQWAREIRAYFKDPKGRVFLVGNTQTVPRAIGSEAQYIVVGYSTLIRNGVVDQLKTVPFDGLIWDECHYANNVTGASAAKRALACVELILELPFKYITALSATPWENHPRELGVVASVLNPEAFPSAEAFRQARPEDPRFLREFFSSNLLEVELREIVDLPEINPRPWEDLFGAEFIDPSPAHRKTYEFIREHEHTELRASQKVQQLLLTTIHPHKMEKLYSWPPEFDVQFKKPDLSTKLKWLKRRIAQELEEGAKVVVATGIYVTGITKPEDEDDQRWVGHYLREWFGRDRVLVLDQQVSQRIDKNGSSERDRLIQKWQSDPTARILLVSMRTCPDSVNLSVPKQPGIKKLFLTTLSYPWVPWKQFQGRFWRKGLGVPMEYAVPVLRGTIDENLLGLVRQKWEVQRLFRAQVPLTEQELSMLSRRINVRRLAEESRSDMQKVNIIGSMVRGRGERGAQQVLADTYGTSTNAEVFARSFIATQEYMASGHISRFMREAIVQLEEQGMVQSEGILDAGCGPLTLERRLGQPVYGVDMNPAAIELARRISPFHGRNARVGFLSALPQEWSKRFELTVCSLVIDWTSIKDRVGEMTERLAVLSELVRVTHPYGRIWIATTHQSMSESILKTWCEGLTALRFVIVEKLTGLVQATDGVSAKQAFSFWSLCFSPNGKAFVSTNPKFYRFAFELERKKVRRGGGVKSEPKDQSKFEHHNFEVIRLSGERAPMSIAVAETVNQEVIRLASVPNLQGWRFHRKPQLPWRVYQKLYERGALDELKARGLI